VGSLQRLYGNQAVLQARNGSGGQLAPSVPLRPRQSGILQRKCACGGAAGVSGECEECSKKKQLGLQAKLQISEAGDIYEREADRVADQVMSTSTHSGVTGSPPRIQCLAGQSIGQAEAAPASVDQALASPGRSLEPELRQDMEQRFGYDFSRVRLHSGSVAKQSAQDLNAHAYTVGPDVVFGAGRFAPETHEGRGLIAHELTHVVQADPTALRMALRPSSVETLEGEARRVARAVGSADPLPPIRGSARGLAAPLLEGPDDPDRPTFGNLPRDAPDPQGVRRRVELVQQGGVWYEQRGGRKFRAEGRTTSWFRGARSGR
jgi:hypothetical protein